MAGEILRRDVYINLDESYLSKVFGENDKGFPFTIENSIISEVVVGNLEREIGEDAGLYQIYSSQLNKS